MNLRKQKNLAARALGVSKNRVKLVITDSESKKNLKELISREGARELFVEKVIKKVPKKGNSRTNANTILEQKKKGRRAGHGNRKGTANARFSEKRKWIIKIRALRTLLQKLKEEGKIEQKDFRSLYLRAKGNFFRNKRHMMLVMEQSGVLKSAEVEKKTKKVSKEVKEE